MTPNTKKRFPVLPSAIRQNGGAKLKTNPTESDSTLSHVQSLVNRLPQGLMDYVQNPPESGKRHHWRYVTAIKLCHYLEDADIVTLLDHFVPGDPGENEHQVKSARSWSEGRENGGEYQTWPNRDESLIRKITSEHGGLDELKALSAPFVDASEWIIDRLYSGDPLLYAAKDELDYGETKPREQWRGQLARMSLMIPNTMTAPTGRTLKGNVSPRAKSNTGGRRFLIIDQDSGTFDQQAGILLYLRDIAPLALVVYSGGRSLHGWFFCAGQPEVPWRKFMHDAVQIGADEQMWKQSQLCRIPGGLRPPKKKRFGDTGTRQTVLYFNSEVIE